MVIIKNAAISSAAVNRKNGVTGLTDWNRNPPVSEPDAAERALIIPKSAVIRPLIILGVRSD